MNPGPLLFGLPKASVSLQKSSFVGLLPKTGSMTLVQRRIGRAELRRGRIEHYRPRRCQRSSFSYFSSSTRIRCDLARAWTMWRRKGNDRMILAPRRSRTGIISGTISHEGMNTQHASRNPEETDRLLPDLIRWSLSHNQDAKDWEKPNLRRGHGSAL
jgi:hypothetical protein